MDRKRTTMLLVGVGLLVVACVAYLASAPGDGSIVQANKQMTSGDYAKAEETLKQSLLSEEKKHGKDAVQLCDDLNLLGKLYLKEGRVADAKKVYERSLKIRQDDMKPQMLALADSLNGLGNTYMAQGNGQKAE